MPSCHVTWLRLSLLLSGSTVIKIMLQQENSDNYHVLYLSMSGFIFLRNFKEFQRMNICVDLWKTMFWAFRKTCTTIQLVKKVGELTESGRSVCWSLHPAILSQPYPIQSTSHSHTIFCGLF